MARVGWKGPAYCCSRAVTSRSALPTGQAFGVRGVYNLSASSRESKTAHRYASCAFQKIQLLCPPQRRNKNPDPLNSNEEETDCFLMQKRYK